MTQSQIKKFMYYLMDRYAAGYEPTESQYQNALADFQKQELPKRTTEVNNLHQRRKPINVVVK